MFEKLDPDQKTILVVDDCVIHRSMARTALEDAGYAIADATDGAEALAILDCVDVDMVICDESMPNMTGIEFLRVVRRSPTHQAVPVLMLTSVPLAEAMAQAGDLQVEGWMPKPLAPLALAEMVTTMLGGGRAFDDDEF